MKWVYIKNGNTVAQLERLRNVIDTPPQGGTEAFIGDFLKNTKGQEVVLLSAHKSEGEMRINGTRARCYNVFGVKGRLRKMFMALRACILAVVEMISFNPDRIICGRLGFFLWMAFLVSKAKRIPLVFSSHNGLSIGKAMKSNFEISLNNFCIKRVNGAVCNGPYLKDELVGIGVLEERVFQFDVDLKPFVEQASSITGHNQNLPDRYVLFVGRVEANKGVFDLLNAFVVEKDHSFSVVYAGSGTAFDALQREVQQKGVRDKVICIGRVDHKELAAIVKGSLAVVTPTRSDFPEGRCMVAMEALALGVPVIAPDYGPFPYLVKNDVNGLLYPVDDVEHLAKCLSRIATQNALVERLRSGAANSQDLIEPPMSFYEAVESAFY